MGSNRKSLLMCFEAFTAWCAITHVRNVSNQKNPTTSFQVGYSSTVVHFNLNRVSEIEKRIQSNGNGCDEEGSLYIAVKFLSMLRGGWVDGVVSSNSSTASSSAFLSLGPFSPTAQFNIDVIFRSLPLGGFEIEPKSKA